MRPHRPRVGAVSSAGRTAPPITKENAMPETMTHTTDPRGDTVSGRDGFIVVDFEGTEVHFVPCSKDGRMRERVLDGMLMRVDSVHRPRHARRPGRRLVTPQAYTITVFPAPTGRWWWSVWQDGACVDRGDSDSIEGALARAENRLLIHQRTGA